MINNAGDFYGALERRIKEEAHEEVAHDPEGVCPWEMEEEVQRRLDNLVEILVLESMFRPHNVAAVSSSGV